MFCESEFFNFNQVWNTTDPDFSSCFHKTVLLWIPIGYLILVAPLRILLLHKSGNNFIIPWSWKTRIRLALGVILGLLAAIDIGRSLHEHLNGGGVPTVNFLSPLSIVLAMVTFCLVVFIERKHGVQSSGFLFMFWFLLVLVSIFNLRSQIRVASLEGMVEDMFRLVTFSLFFTVVLIQFILACVVVDSTPVGAIPLDDKNPCPEHHVSFLSQITFWWFSSIVVQGYKRALVVKDLWSLNPEDKCKNVYPQFEKYWNAELARCKKLHLTGKAEPREIEMKEMGAGKQDGTPEVIMSETDCKKSTPRLFLAIMKTFGMNTFVAAIFKFLFDMMQFVSPIILKYLIEYTANKNIQNWKGYLYATLMLVVALVQSVVLHQYFFHCTVVGMRMRTSMIAAVYQKMLKLSNAARKTSTVGEIVNLMSVDAQRLMDMMTYINLIWSGPLQITISIYLLWVTLGPSVLAGVAFMIIMIPLNGVIANQFKKFQVKQMGLKDKRIKMMNEILNGIKVLKLYAWEPSFEQKVLDIRNKELNILKKMSYLNAVTTFTWTVVPFLVSLITFAVYVMVDENNILDADKAFVSLSLFNILRFPLSMVPQVVSSLVQVNVSVKRLRDFLGADELDLEAVTYDDNAKSAVKIENASFVWDKELMEKENTGATLSGINLDISEGQLIAVVGTVGSGKSSLLAAILGEMDKIAGGVTIKGSTAYVAQQAWIQNATLMDNVLFGRPFDLSSYRQVIDACALQSDLEIMPAGDQTEIGEKGINLSGGQKQRVSLARAVFQDADTYLMDDPLSAVDSHVGKHIFDNVIGPNGILKGKTRVLVTHGVGFLPQVDTIVVLVDGKISEMGSYQELLDHDGAFSQFLKNYLTEEMNKDDADLELDAEIMSQIGSIVESKSDSKLQKQISMLSERMRTMSDTNTATPPGTPGAVRKVKSKESLKASRTSLHKTDIPNGVEKDLKGGKEEEKKLIEAEKMETARVKFSVFLVYLRSVGVLLGVSTIVFYILTNAANIYSNIWLSEWSNDANNVTIVNGTVIVDTGLRNMRLGIYGLLGVIQGFTIIIGALSLNLGNLRAGNNLHAKLLKNIVSSPMGFFDTTPTGRILNRFASEIDILDRRVPEILTSWIQVVLKVLSVPIIVGWITPLFLVAAVPLGASYFIAQRFYVATSRQLKRLESVSRSPIYSHFGETVMGVTTVRAYKQQERFIETSEVKVDENLICHYPSIVSNRWLAIRLEFVGNCILFFAALFAVIARNDLSPGIVGLSITYALNITQTLNWMVRMTTELETNIVAVERVKEYSDTPTEADWEVKDKKPKADWPDQGVVEFERYGTRYRPGLDLVVKDLNCKIQSGEKVGIVGRTGAGKSSLTLALFRIIEPAEGQIKIDGLDIKVMGLHDLRSKLTIIPQEPVLFSGSLRMNLDPFDEHTDELLWQALEHAHLKMFVSELPAKLEHECTEGGENLSVGQRQLVCLARALLRKTKILVLDEATAAVDLETDDLIQHTIRVEFKDATVLTIAHRLNTIMDYNRVMVLDQGNLREFDSPQALLQQEDSIFYGMAKDAGLA